MDGISTVNIRFSGPQRDMFPSAEGISEMKVQGAGGRGVWRCSGHYDYQQGGHQRISRALTGLTLRVIPTTFSTLARSGGIRTCC